MSSPRLGLAGSLALAVAWGLAASSIAPAQLPRDVTADPVATPEEMIDQALLKIETGDLPEATDLVQRAKMLNPTLDKILLAEGLLDIEAGRPLEAIATLENYKNTEEGKDDYRGYAAIGAIYKRSLKYRLAATALRQAKELAVRAKDSRGLRAELALDLAMVYAQLKRYTKATEAAREAERLAPNDPKVQLGLGRIAANSGNVEVATKSVEQAIALLKTELKKDPLKEQLYLDLRSCYQLAVSLQQQENTLRPEDGLPYFSLALITADDAELSRRIGLLTSRQYALEALARDPESNDYRIYVARLEADLGATEEAWKKLDEVLRADPDNRPAHLLRESLQTIANAPADP
jgi:tetratricopeptide (TPR) repeat protein